MIDPEDITLKITNDVTRAYGHTGTQEIFYAVMIAMSDAMTAYGEERYSAGFDAGREQAAA